MGNLGKIIFRDDGQLVSVWLANRQQEDPWCFFRQPAGWKKMTRVEQMLYFLDTRQKSTLLPVSTLC